MSLENRGFQFGEFSVDLEERTLLRDGKAVSITPKALGLLIELIKHPAEILTKEVLLDSVWAGTTVEDGNLTFTINLLRKALGDDVKHPTFIETLPRRGYRFIAPVKNWDASAEVSQVGVYEHSLVKDDSASSVAASSSGIRYIFIAALSLILLTLIAIFWITFLKSQNSLVGRGEILQITTNGETVDLSSSPNGNFLAYVLDNGDYQSLFLHDVVNDNDIRLSPIDSREKITSVTFAPDGEYIYYASTRGLNRIGLLGGNPELVLADPREKSNFTISPDGRQAAFIRESSGDTGTDLVIANLADHTERILAASQYPRNFYDRVAWSPDGNSIACARAGSVGEALSIVDLSLSDGIELRKFKLIEIISDLIWKRDSSALLASACAKHLCRIVQYDISSGETTSVTDDLTSYTHLSMAADGSRLFAIRQDAGSNLFIVPASGGSPVKQLTNGFNRFDGAYSLIWTHQGEIEFGSQPREKGETDAIRPDGTDQRQIVKDFADGISPDGRYLVMSPSHEEVPVINVYDTVAGTYRSIESGFSDVSHVISPDGAWTAFTRWSGTPGIWKVPMAGGAAVRLTPEATVAQWPGISPDGRFVAFYKDDAASGTAAIGIVNSSGGPIVKQFAIKAQLFGDGKTAPQWSRDGKSIYFVRLSDGSSNIWKQPLNGKEPAQVTQFKSGRIYNFAFSPDETQIALSYSSLSRDIVEIK